MKWEHNLDFWKEITNIFFSTHKSMIQNQHQKSRNNCSVFFGKMEPIFLTPPWATWPVHTGAPSPTISQLAGQVAQRILLLVGVELEI